MKRGIVIFGSIYFLILLSAFSIKHLYSDNSVEPIEYKKEDLYTAQWAKVDSLEQLALPKSAMQEVNKIYKKAKQEGNISQTLKSIIFQVKFDKQLSNNGTEEALQRLSKELTNAKEPSRSVLHSLKAELLLEYYKNRSYNWGQGSVRYNKDEQDMTKWTKRQMAEAIIAEYQASLESSDSLFRISLELITPILSPVENHYKTLSLFDFLANRAIDAYANNYYILNAKLSNHCFESKDFFTDAQHFTQIKYKKQSATDWTYFIFDNLKQILDFYLQNPKPKRFIEAELYRLNLMERLSTFAQKDALYYTALKELLSKNKNLFYANKIRLALAEKAYSMSQNRSNISEEEKQNSTQLQKEALNYINQIGTQKKDSTWYYKAQDIRNRIEKSQLEFKSEICLIPGEHSPALVNYKNIKNLQIDIYKISRDQHNNIDYQTINDSSALKKYMQEKYKHLEFSIPEEQDYQTHSSEFILPALEEGYYFLALKAKKLFPSATEKESVQEYIYNYSTLQSTDLALIDRSIGQDLDVLAINRKTGEALPEATIKIWQYSNYGHSRNKSVFKTLKTNKKGELKTKVNKHKSYTLELVYKEKHLFDNRYLYSSNNNPIGQTRLFIYTDRNIYRPGQKVLFKAVLNRKMQNDIRLGVNEKISIELKNSNYRTLAKQKLTSNDWGSVQGSFTIPKESLGGKMFLSTAYGQQTIQVEAYKRPEFEVAIDPFNGINTFGKQITIKGKAQGFSGSSLKGQNFHYNIRLSNNWRWSENDQVVAQGEGQVDDKGEFSFHFTPSVSESHIPFVNRNQANQVQNYNIEVEVQNKAGQFNSASANLVVGNSPVHINIEAPRNVLINSNDSIGLHVVNLNNQTVNQDIEWELSRDNSANQDFKINTYWGKAETSWASPTEWKNLLPYYTDKYQEEKRSHLKTIRLGTNASGSFIKLDYKKLREGTYLLKSHLKGSNYPNSESVYRFTVVNPKTNFTPKNQALFLQVFDKESMTKQSVIKAFVGSGLAKQNVRVQAFCNEKVILNRWLTIDQRKRILEIPIDHRMMGTMQLKLTCVYQNRIYSESTKVELPEKKEIIKLNLETFRDTLYPGKKEQWKIKIKGVPTQDVELLANMYDASLDQFYTQQWSTNFYSYPLFYNFYKGSYFHAQSGRTPYIKGIYRPIKERFKPTLNWFGFSPSYAVAYRGSRNMVETKNAPMAQASLMADDKLEEKPIPDSEKTVAGVVGLPLDNTRPRKAFRKLKIRENFKETAFFFPQLKANAEGEVVLDFTLPESLTQWKFRALAYNKKMEYGVIEKQFISQKELMVQSNPPRFYYQGDQVELPIEISNLQKKDCKVQLSIQLYNNDTKENISRTLLGTDNVKQISLKAEGNQVIKFAFKIPESLQNLRYKIVASGKNHADGEARIIPILSPKILLTESLAFTVKAEQKENFSFENFNKNFSKVARNVKYKVEISAQPSWYAFMSLPYLSQSEIKNTDAYVNSWFSKAIALQLLDKQTGLKEALAIFKDQTISANKKNEDIKQITPQLSPFFEQLEDEAEQKRQLIRFFKQNDLRMGMLHALEYLSTKQMSSGAWAWFDGMHENRFISQQILLKMAHLKALGIDVKKSFSKYAYMQSKLIAYLDRKAYEDYNNRLKRKEYKRDEYIISAQTIQYLYARSFFLESYKVIPEHQNMFDELKKALRQQWVKQNPYIKALCARTLINMEGDHAKEIPIIVQSIKETALHLKDGAIAWKSKGISYHWYQSEVEQAAEILSLFKSLKLEKEWIEGVEMHLLQLKRSTLWANNSQTAKAVFALLQGQEEISTQLPDVKVKVGKKTLKAKGKDKKSFNYFSNTWGEKDLNPSMAKINVSNKTGHMIWGAAYWQYYQDLDKIEAHSGDLKIEKQIFIEDEAGQEVRLLKAGESIPFGKTLKVKLLINNKRAMDFVHIEDKRAAALELKSQTSSYKYQGAIAFYQTFSDRASHFFIEHLPKGHFSIEYKLFVAYTGKYTNGIARIQSQYAPEYSAHSRGGRLTIK